MALDETVERARLRGPSTLDSPTRRTSRGFPFAPYYYQRRASSSAVARLVSTARPSIAGKRCNDKRQPDRRSTWLHPLRSLPRPGRKPGIEIDMKKKTR